MFHLCSRRFGTERVVGIHVKWPFEGPGRRVSRLRGKGLSPSSFAGLGERFHFWEGASGRRYVCSVFAADDAAPDALDLSCAVVLAVERSPVGVCRALSILPSSMPLRLKEGGGQWLAGRAPNEFHVHLLPRDGNERDAALADLQLAIIRSH
jgi:hypothetical protein